MLQHASVIRDLALMPPWPNKTADPSWMLSCYKNKIKQIRKMALVGWFAQ